MPAHLDLQFGTILAAEQGHTLLRSPIEGCMVNQIVSSNLVMHHDQINNGSMITGNTRSYLQQQQQQQEENQIFNQNQQQKLQYNLLPEPSATSNNHFLNNHDHQYFHQQQQHHHIDTDQFQQTMYRQMQHVVINNQTSILHRLMPEKNMLISTLEWVKSVACFNDLAKSDQVSLLRSNLNELYILSIAQYCSTRQIHPKCNSTVLLHSPATSRENSNKRGFNSTNCHLNKPSISLQQQQQHQQQQQKQQQFVQMQHIQYLQYIEQQRRKTFVQRENQSTPENNATNTITTVFEDLVGKFSCLQTDNVEFSYLKALVLFNPATQGIQNPSLVETLQERAQQALEDYISERSDRNHHFSLRYGKLLLRLPALSLLRSTPQMAPSCLFSGLVLDESLKENLILQTVYQCSNNV